MLSVVSKNFDPTKQKKVAKHCYIDLVCSSVETQHNRAHVLPISNSFRKFEIRGGTCREAIRNNYREDYRRD